jgi:sugar phosphate isomerase/epimerase
MTENKNRKFPRIHLAVDNCFAIKRWVEPAEWMRKVKQLGDIRYIQASTDNEIDPSHNTQSFRDEWIGEVKKYEHELDLKVSSFYSGYATYRTVGIASLSKSKRGAMIDKYFKPVVDVAAALQAQVGNTLSAYSDTALQNPELFRITTDHIENSLADMVVYAGERGVPFGYEQMYTPTQGMWTIDGCISCMKNVYARTRYPMYLTIDTAHQAGQRMFLRPGPDDVQRMIRTGDTHEYRLPDEIVKAIGEKQPVERVEELLGRFDYWFAQPRDADLFEWLGNLGAYSPVIHLQQTDGTYSSHKPFTSTYNATGIVKPKDVLSAIAKSYENPDVEGMPVKVADIYLAFEIFFGVTESTDSILSDMRESVAYWREYIPQDGLTLDMLI